MNRKKSSALTLTNTVQAGLLSRMAKFAKQFVVETQNGSLEYTVNSVKAQVALVYHDQAVGSKSMI